MLDYFKKYASTKKNIKVQLTANGFVIKYYFTNIVRLDDAEIVLRHDGFTTKSTKNHMNAALREFHMYISQKDWAWTLHYGQKAIPFENGMRINILNALL